MAGVHLAEGLADVVDVALAIAAAFALVRRRGFLAWVVLLLAVDPLWSAAMQALAAWAGFGATPVEQVLAVVLADAPLWAAFMLGLARVLGAEPVSARRTPDVAGQ